MSPLRVSSFAGVIIASDIELTKSLPVFLRTSNNPTSSFDPFSSPFTNSGAFTLSSAKSDEQTQLFRIGFLDLLDL